MDKNTWKVLGIKKTKDKDEIKKAYRTKLVDVNPEDDPKGFMMLRNAFEEANAYADKEEDENALDMVEDPFMHRLNEIYNDFEKRINLEVWEDFLNEDWFVSLEQEDESIHKTLDFMLNHFFISHDVLKLIVDRFDLKEQRTRFYEEYSQNFIDHLLNNANYNDSINYYLFDFETIKGKSVEEIDGFIQNYYDVYNALHNHDVTTQEKYIQELVASDIVHPYVTIVQIRHEIQDLETTFSQNYDMTEKGEDIRFSKLYQNQLFELQERADSLLLQYKDTKDLAFWIMCGDIAFLREDFKKAEDYYGYAYSVTPNDYLVKKKMGEIYLQKKEFEKAKDIFIDLLDISNYDYGARMGLTRANEGIISTLEAKVEEDATNQENVFTLAWCYYRNSLFNETIELLEKMEPTDDNQFEYNNLLGRNYMYTERYDEAIACFEKWISLMDNICIEHASDEEKKHKSKYQYAHFFLGDCYMRMKKFDEARKNFYIAIAKEHEEILYSYEDLCRLEFNCHNYEECIRICDLTLERDDCNYDAAMFKAKALFELQAYNECMYACERAMKIYPYFSEPYLIQIRIFNRFEEYENSLSVIERYNQFGIDSDAIDYYKGYIMTEQGDYERSAKLLEQVLSRFETGDKEADDLRKKNTDMEEINDIRIILAANYQELNDLEKAINMIEKAREEDKDSVFLINRLAGLHGTLNHNEEAVKYYDEILSADYKEDYEERAFVGKAAALSRMRRFEEAIKVFDELEQKIGYEGYYIIDHGELLVRMKRMDDAMTLMKKCIEEQDDEERVQCFIGNLCCFLGNEGRLEEAYKIFLLGIERQEEDHQLYRSMGYIYLEHGEYEKALELFEKAFKFDKEHDGRISGAILNCMNKLGKTDKKLQSKYITVAKEQFKYIDSANDYVKYAEFLRAMGEYEKALKMIDCALLMKRGQYVFFSEYHEAWFEMGNIYVDMEQYEKAIDCYKKALQEVGHSELYRMHIQALEEKR